MTTRELVAEAWERLGGNVSAVARELGKDRATVRHHLRKLGLDKKPLTAGTVRAKRARSEAPPKRGVRRFILTCAQNNTILHDQVWENLLALKEHWDAELYVATFSYNKNAYGKLAVKEGTEDHQSDVWYDRRIRPYQVDENVEIAPGLLWCGKMNIQPTQVNPLSGLTAHGGRKSCVYPHVKIAMQSVASAREEATKLLFTTGTVTQVNYIQMKAGQKEEWHHCYGALLVEVDTEGRWFCRQLNAVSRTGQIQDLTTLVDKGEVIEGCSVEAINWGDFHHAHLEDWVGTIGWRMEGSMLDVLRPKYQFIHDLLDQYARNPHDLDNPHRMYLRYAEKKEIVEEEVGDCAGLLLELYREDCQLVVVDSNHDNMLARWLNKANYKTDHINALYILQLEREIRLALKRKAEREAKLRRRLRPNEEWHLVEWAIRRFGVPLGTRFLREDEPFAICRKKIECGMHGHLGTNGSRGSPRGLSNMGRRANTGHTHSAAIINGMYVAGTSSELDLLYTAGPGSWSHSHIITYPNGKRTIVTMWDGKWRA